MKKQFEKTKNTCSIGNESLEKSQTNEEYLSFEYKGFFYIIINAVVRNDADDSSTNIENENKL
jgi:hypothetical protein